MRPKVGPASMTKGSTRIDADAFSGRRKLARQVLQHCGYCGVSHPTRPNISNVGGLLQLLLCSFQNAAYGFEPQFQQLASLPIRDIKDRDRLGQLLLKCNSVCLGWHFGNVVNE